MNGLTTIAHIISIPYQIHLIHFRKPHHKLFIITVNHFITYLITLGIYTVFVLFQKLERFNILR